MRLFLFSSADTLNSAWLSLLMDPRLHSTLCGLITKAAFLLRLLKTSDDVRHLCDSSALHEAVQEVCSLLSQSGVHFPTALTAAVAGDLPLWQYGGAFSVRSMSKGFWPMRQRIKLPVDISGLSMTSTCAALVWMSSATADAAVHQHLADWVSYVRAQWLHPVVSIIILPIQSRDPLGGEQCRTFPHNLSWPLFCYNPFNKDSL